jgi:hypothetical protein
MGNLIQDLLAEDLNEIVTDIGHTCTWKGVSYDCVISEPDMEADVDVGGFMPEGASISRFHAPHSVRVRVRSRLSPIASLTAGSSIAFFRQPTKTIRHTSA